MFSDFFTALNVIFPISINPFIINCPLIFIKLNIPFTTIIATSATLIAAYAIFLIVYLATFDTFSFDIFIISFALFFISIDLFFIITADRFTFFTASLNKCIVDFFNSDPTNFISSVLILSSVFN